MTVYIFESPDHGVTVYRREFGSNDRELYIDKGSPVKLNYGMWADIIKLGTTNAAVQDALERLIVIYELSKP
jgi:hypothetical protein